MSLRLHAAKSLPLAFDEFCCTRYTPSFRHGLSSGIHPLYQRNGLILSGILCGEDGLFCGESWPSFNGGSGILLVAEIGILYFTIYNVSYLIRYWNNFDGLDGSGVVHSFVYLFDGMCLPP